MAGVKAGAINFKTLALKQAWPVDLFVGNLVINSRMSFSVRYVERFHVSCKS